jgi:RHS repeat-associated protein
VNLLEPSVSYDTSGEETSSPQLSNLSYNTADQTTSITPSGSSAESLSYADVGQALLTTVGSTTLAYGPLGLASAVTGSTTTYFVHDPYGNIVGETVGTAATRYFLKDSLGSVIAVINGSGSSVRDRYAYGPYGVMTVVSGSDYEPIRYASGYHDANSLFTRFGTRYYDPSTGRWTQMDPIGGSIANPATLNGYIYAGDDPVNNVDPTGENFLGDLAAVGIAVVTAGAAIASLPAIVIAGTIAGILLAVDLATCDLGFGIGCGEIG